MKKVLLLLLSLTLLSGCRYDFKYSSRIYGENYTNLENMTSNRFSKEYFNMPFYPSKIMWGETNITFGRLIGSASSLKVANEKIRKHFNNESYGTKNEVADSKLVFENEYVYGIYTEWNYFGYNVVQNLNENVYLLKEDKCQVIQNNNNEEYYIKVDSKEEMCSVITYIYYPMTMIGGFKLLSIPVEEVKEVDSDWFINMYYCYVNFGDYDIPVNTCLYRQELKVSKKSGFVEELETIKITEFSMNQTEFREKYVNSLEEL